MTDRLRDALRHVTSALAGYVSSDPADKINAPDTPLYSIATGALDEADAALAEPDVCEWYRDGGNFAHGGCLKCSSLSTNLLQATMSMVEDHRATIYYAPGCGRKIEVKE